ncbi:MAG: hypothetical protein IKU00_04790 [Bacteroidales bacterium]|nr:hypothetical protein [Bacteroidales bacterium]
MKKLFLTVLVSMMAFAAASAQQSEKVRYSEIKGNYNPKEYVKQATDPYHVGWYEATSFFIPGIGQLLSGETWRGLAFIGGEAILISVIKTAADNIAEVAITNESGFLTGYTDPKVGKRNMAVMLTALGVDLGLSIWSSIDARNVARVKNMYYQDLINGKKPVELSFAPTLSLASDPSGALQPCAGVSMQLKF